MNKLRKSHERGFANHGWLKSHHTFSFADYYDPNFMGFGPLRVINEDFITGGAGFPTHGHRDMEIITYPISGAVEHKDSTGSSGVIYPYEIQKMTAGRGITHSEFNHFKDTPTHLLQIWIEPQHKGLEPTYEQKDYSVMINSHEPTLLVSQTGRNGSLKIHQHLDLWVKKSLAQQRWSLPCLPKNKYWIQVIAGQIQIIETASEGHKTSLLLINQGDAMSAWSCDQLEIISQTDSEFLLFELGN